MRIQRVHGPSANRPNRGNEIGAGSPPVCGLNHIHHRPCNDENTRPPEQRFHQIGHKKEPALLGRAVHRDNSAPVGFYSLINAPLTWISNTHSMGRPMRMPAALSLFSRESFSGLKSERLENSGQRAETGKRSLYKIGSNKTSQPQPIRTVQLGKQKA